jgi:hypothetical protein
MFDVFYTGTRPNRFSHERQVKSIEQAQQQCRTRYFWWITYLADYSEFDFLWEPVPWQSHQRHAWPSQWQKDAGVYLVPREGYADTNYHTAPVVNRVHKEKDRWQVPKGIDTESFDWTWHPDPTEPPYIYQFGTQHQRTGGPQYHAPGATDIKFVDQIRVQTNRVATAIYEIDHMDGSAGQIPNTTRRIRYFDNYKDTLIRLARSIGNEHEFVWVCSSICDYKDFDFSWHPEQWQASMLHVFASDDQKFGDTFFMHVPTFAHRAERVELLEWYDCNFVKHMQVPRHNVPKIKYDTDSVVDVIKNHEFHQPVVQFYRHTICDATPTINLWRNSTKAVIPLSADNSTVIAPREIKSYIQQQAYDYPYIDKTHRSLVQAQLQDIVFISYDEPDAEQNWQTLVERFPRAQRVHGVKGMETALEAAADLAQTPWYFAVFAKTRLYEQFDFSFVPDYMQQPKHYIFNARNTVNGLEYGHMGVIMYNSQGIRKVNQTKDFGVDYTLSFAHEAIPILSCYGEFDQTPYHTWRTAFREASKLAYFEYEQTTVDGAYRLNIWQTQASGPYAEWCLRGANDGVEFFKNSDRQLTTIKQAFRWEWLRDYFVTRYGNLE